jgi:tetratricopeptide (TPR) repeat protein
MERDSYLALEMGLAHTFLVANRTQFKPRNEPERMKFYEMDLAASIIRTERAGEPPAPLNVAPLLDACMNAGDMHVAARRFENATYWLVQGAFLAEKTSFNDLGLSMWYNAGLCNDTSNADNLPEQARCFLSALKLLPKTRKPDRSTNEETFKERLTILREIGSFFFSERLVSMNPALREKGVECFLQALDDLKEAHQEEKFYPSAAKMRSQLGMFYLETDQPDYAHWHFRKAVATWKNGISQTWKNESSQQPSKVREELAETLNQLGNALESLAGKERAGERERTLQEAQGSFKESRGIYRDLFAITPLSDLQTRATYHLRAQTLARNEGRVAGSQGHWEDVVSILESAVRFEGMMPKFSYCETFDKIKQDLIHARSEVRGVNDEASRTIKNVNSREENSRKTTLN